MIIKQIYFSEDSDVHNGIGFCCVFILRLAACPSVEWRRYS